MMIRTIPDGRDDDIFDMTTMIPDEGDMFVTLLFMIPDSRDDNDDDTQE